MVCLCLLAIKMAKEKNLVSVFILLCKTSSSIQMLAVHYLINHCICFLQEIFEVAREDGTVLAMKLHRLGRNSFMVSKLNEITWGIEVVTTGCICPGSLQPKNLLLWKVLHSCYAAKHWGYRKCLCFIDWWWWEGHKLTMIDFPQMVSVDHRNAQM